MEPIPKIKLPVPYKAPKTSKTLQKIDNKLKLLNKTGSKKITTFFGSNEVEAMFYLYLFKKYKSKCFLYDRNARTRILGMSIKINIQYTMIEQSQIENQIDNLTRILANCIKTPDTKIIIIPVTLVFSDGGGHANVLIYRKKLNQIEHFEPHGQYFKKKSSIDNIIIKKWMTFFVEELNKKLQSSKKPEVKFIESSEVCPYIDGLQNLESWSNLTKLAVEPSGYCAAWSLFFTELSLKNPDIPSSILMNYIFDTLQNMSNIEKRNYLKSVIRGYSVFINEKIYKYFSVFFNSGITIEKLKTLSGVNLAKFNEMLQYLIRIEMNLSTDPSYLTTTLEEIELKLAHINEQLNISADKEDIQKEIKKLLNTKNFFALYNRFNVFSEPSEMSSDSSENKIRACPEGKELNPKTGRCIKTKTQKVRKIKSPKKLLASPNEPPASPNEPPPKLTVFKRKQINGEFYYMSTDNVLYDITMKEKVGIWDEKNQKILKLKVCPEGKELNPKTGRCIKIKTQKIKK